ncbi:acylphosphatase [Microbacterium album]|uniref:acylphosphatase n=1 Tax=Microbacterium album TaxID=2053191 RepID=A0A917ID90_9MICO|nr:acylphosphatase [Microbacterium album]GGH36618.1 acylphosphatase [Microbacterium album]
MKRVRVTVRGRVQGVGYRFGASAAAAECGVSGWVRNTSDGSVEAEVEGEPAAVDAMLAWMSQGPATARVDGLDVADVVPTGVPGFRVLRDP